jgi:hypothetical protein
VLFRTVLAGLSYFVLESGFEQAVLSFLFKVHFLDFESEQLSLFIHSLVIF